jgi:hypothetical protein
MLTLNISISIRGQLKQPIKFLDEILSKTYIFYTVLNSIRKTLNKEKCLLSGDLKIIALHRASPNSLLNHENLKINVPYSQWWMKTAL